MSCVQLVWSVWCPSEGSFIINTASWDDVQISCQSLSESPCLPFSQLFRLQHGKVEYRIHKYSSLCIAVNLGNKYWAVNKSKQANKNLEVFTVNFCPPSTTHTHSLFNWWAFKKKKKKLPSGQIRRILSNHIIYLKTQSIICLFHLVLKNIKFGSLWEEILQKENAHIQQSKI